MERKRDLIISWRYASLAMNWGAIKRGFTVYTVLYFSIYSTLVCWPRVEYYRISQNQLSYLISYLLWYQRILVMILVSLPAVHIHELGISSQTGQDPSRK